MGRKVGSRRVVRCLSAALTLGGLAMSASGIVVLVRGSGSPASAGPPTATGIDISKPGASDPDPTTVLSATTVAPAVEPTVAPDTTSPVTNPAVWASCENTELHLTLSYPPSWATPNPPDADACRVFHVVESGDAGLGNIVVEHADGMTLDDFVAQALEPAHADVVFTHTMVMRGERPMLRAVGTGIDGAEPAVGLLFAVADANGIAIVEWLGGGVTAEDEDNLAAVAASEEPTG